jgi:AcrR family transcriptional regulator
MTEYALAPSRKFTATSAQTPSAMLEQGVLNAYRVRSNGSMRHLELYPLASTAREAAEWINDRVEMDGASVQAVARELHVSTPTVRRYLEGLALTEEIESGEWDDLRFNNAGDPVWLAPTEDDEETVQGGSVALTCTCAAELLDQAVHEPACAKYVPVAETPREAYEARTRRPARPVADVVKAAGLPWPTDEERAAALADVPGSQCEPVGTPADEVRSVRPWRSASATTWARTVRVVCRAARTWPPPCAGSAATSRSRSSSPSPQVVGAG